MKDMVFGDLIFPGDKIPRHITRRIGDGLLVTKNPEAEYKKFIEHTLSKFYRIFIIQEPTNFKDKVYLITKDRWIVIYMLETKIITTCFRLYDNFRDIDHYLEENNKEFITKVGQPTVIEELKNGKYKEIADSIQSSFGSV